jgi:tetratricopeptide (TPR) repeat protein
MSGDVAKTEHDNPDIKVGGPAISRMRFFRGRRFRVTATAAVIVIIALAGYFGWRYHVSSVAKADNQKYSGVQTAADLLSSNGHFDQAANLWVAYAAGTSNRVHKGSAYVNAAIIYLSDNQYAQAYAMCQKAEAANGITYTEAEEAAVAAQGLGKKAVAIRYYQEAIRLIPASTSLPEIQKSIFNAEIQQLQAKP